MLFDLETGRRFSDEAHAARELGISVAEVRRQVEFCWLVRLRTPNVPARVPTATPAAINRAA